MRETTTVTGHEMIEQAAKGTHNKAIEIIRSLRSPERNPRALDAPCGHGGISKILTELGYHVEALDISPPDHVNALTHIVRHDLNEALPYADDEFDLCVSVEGIEHLERPADFFHELVRILRSGGHLIISTPNPDSIQSRYRMFVKGYPTHFNPVSATERTSGHIHPIDRIFIERHRLQANLELIDISTNKMRGKKFPWTIMKKSLSRKLPDICRNDVVLFGDVIIYHFIKR